MRDADSTPDLTGPQRMRRSLLLGGVAGAGALLLPRISRAQLGAPRSRPLVVVNALGGIANPNVPAERGEAGIARAETLVVDDRAIADARRSGLAAANVTMGYVAGSAEPFEASVRDVAAWDARIRSMPDALLKVHRATDITAAHRSGRIGVIYGFQNSAMLGDDVERIGLFANLGVRVIQLTYNLRNLVGSGCLAPEDTGLTSFGHEVVERLDAERIIIDLSHSGERTCLDATAAARRPIAITHTGCRALADLPRNKTDEELRRVAQGGGFVGIYFMPFLAVGRRATAGDVVAHILHALDVCGEDHVGIGTDGGITSHDDMDAYMLALREENAARRAAGISAPGEAPDNPPFVMDLRGPDQFHRLADLLVSRGLRPRQVDKILADNFHAFAATVWGG